MQQVLMASVRSRRPIGGCLCWLLLLLLIAAKVNASAVDDEQLGSLPRAAEQQRRPNFVIILTDDQDVVLNGMVPMENTQRLLANAGVTFNNAFTSSPICCPARASLLTGQYAHNHHTHNNSASGGCYSPNWQQHLEPGALPTHFQQRGYRTFYAGKYLNQYRGQAVPAGWSQWFGLNGNSQYYNYTLTENGVRKRYTNGEYLTDVLGGKIVQFLRNQTAAEDGEPFLAIVAPPSAHAPFNPAPRHRGRFRDVRLMETPNFNVLSDVLDKHWLISAQRPAPLSSATVQYLRTINIRRWQTLLAVDEMVANIVHTLSAAQLLDSTYVIFTSDNGFHLGQFAQGADKRQPYETDIRVPLVVRGPGVAAKTTIDGAVALIDLLPTMLDLSLIDQPDRLDGVSFAEQLLRPANESGHQPPVERQILVQYWGEGDESTYDPSCPYPPDAGLSGCNSHFECHCQDARNNTYACLRQMLADEDTLYCEFQDVEAFAEAYDLREDPYQLRNVAYEMLPSVRNLYSMALGKLANCVGANCRQIYR